MMFILFVFMACGKGNQEGEESGVSSLSDEKTEVDANQSPILLSDQIFASATVVLRGEAVALSIDPFDPDHDDLEILWKAAGGSLSQTDAPSIEWISPVTPGIYTIDVSITDPLGASDSASVAIEVKGQGSVQHVQDWTFFIPDPFLAQEMTQPAGFLLDPQDVNTDMKGFFVILNTKTQDLTQEISDDIHAIESELAGLATLYEQTDNGLVTQTLDQLPAIRRTFLVTFEEPVSVSDLRAKLFYSLTGQTLPSVPGGVTYTTHLVNLFEVLQESSGNILKAAVLTPEDLRPKNAQIMNDLTNATGLVGKHARIAGYRQKQLPELTTVATDFLWVIDNSGSMAEEQTFVANNGLLFCEILESFGFDFRLGVITTDDANLRGGFTSDCLEFSTNVQVGIGGSGFEQGLHFAYLALDPASPERIEVRDDAAITVIFLSDEDDVSVDENGNIRPESFFIDFFNQLSVRTFAFVDLSKDIFPDCPNAATPGWRYIHVSQATQGDQASICASDAEEILEKIAKTAGRTSSDYPIPFSPITASISVTLDGVPSIQGEAYHIDSDQKMIHFTESATPRLKTLIAIEFSRFIW